MELSENIKLAWEGVRGNLMRSVLTTLGIIIGIASIIAVLSVGTSLEEHLIKTMHQILSPTINISVTTRDENAENVTIPQNKMITDDMIRLIKTRFAGKITAVGVSCSFIQMKTEGAHPYKIIAVGINPEFAEIVKANDIVSGRGLTDDDIIRRRKVVIIPDNFAEAYFGKEDPLGKVIVFKTENGLQRFTVVGVFKALSDRYGRKLFLMLNTVGMGLGMCVVMTSDSVAQYILGMLLMMFFTPNDMQVLYILETAPKEKRISVSVPKDRI